MGNHCYLVVLTGNWFFATLNHLCPRLGSSWCSTHFSGFTDQLGPSLVWLWPHTALLTMDFFQKFDVSTLARVFKNLAHLGPHLGSYSYPSTFSGVTYQMSLTLVGFWPNTACLLKPLILAVDFDIWFSGTPVAPYGHPHLCRHILIRLILLICSANLLGHWFWFGRKRPCGLTSSTPPRNGAPSWIAFLVFSSVPGLAARFFGCLGHVPGPRSRPSVGRFRRGFVYGVRPALLRPCGSLFLG